MAKASIFRFSDHCSWIVAYIRMIQVLCEVDDPVQTLKEIDALVKPGGKIYFSEHVASPKGSLSRILQESVNPLWHYCSGACNCNRETIRCMKAKWELGLKQKTVGVKNG